MSNGDQILPTHLYVSHKVPCFGCTSNPEIECRFKAPGFASMVGIQPRRLEKSMTNMGKVILASVGTTVAYSGMVFWPQQVNALLPGSPTKQGLLSVRDFLALILPWFTNGSIECPRLHKSGGICHRWHSIPLSPLASHCSRWIGPIARCHVWCNGIGRTWRLWQGAHVYHIYILIYRLD